LTVYRIEILYEVKKVVNEFSDAVFEESIKEVIKINL